MLKVIVCVDGSSYSEVCCQYAAWLAGRTDAQLELLYVTDLRQFEVPLIADLSGSLGIQPYQAIMGQLQELEGKKAEVILEAAKQIFDEQGLGDRVTSTHKIGLLVDAIGEREEQADLVMLGKRGENANFATEHLGSSMERVVRASSKPCLVTSRSFRPIERVLLAYDGGESSRRAAEFLASSTMLKGLQLHVVTVSDEHEEEAAMAKLREAEDLLRKAGFSPVCQMLHGAPEDAIADYVQTSGVDLLVMGAYGHSRIRYLIIGSTTTAMIRGCYVPVLLFR
jgi:nucleotide-binding universal stress UspA family protein